MRSSAAVVSLAAALSAAVTYSAPARAQARNASDFPVAAIDIGYIALSIAAASKLLGDHYTAHVGDEVWIRRLSVRGRLEAIGADSLTIRNGAVDARVARYEVHTMLIAKGHERKWAQGWGFGLLGGAAAGALLSTKRSPSDCEFFCGSASENALLGGLAGGVLGSASGALVGLAIRGEHWGVVNRFDAAQLTVEPLRGSKLAVAERVVF